MPNNFKADWQGRLNPNLRSLSPSATVAINEESNRLRAEGRKIYKLGLGQSPFPVPELVCQALRDHASEKDYLPVRGLLSLRESVARYHGEREGIERHGEDVIIGPGSKELMFLLQLVYEAELVIPSASWVSYAPQARIIGRPVSHLPTSRDNGFCLRPETLDAHCRATPDRPRLLILNYPNNPTGATYSEPALCELAEVARRHGVVILSDEIYGELQHDGKHVSIARYYPEGTIISSGISKWCGAGGWRLGTFALPKELRWLIGPLTTAASETFTSTSAPIQYAAVSAYQADPRLEAYLRQSRRILAACGGWIARRLTDAQVHCDLPAGGFYVFPDLGEHRESFRARGITTSAQLCERLLAETGVALLPGSDFGRPPEEFSIRAAYVDFDGASALVASAASSEPLGEPFLRTYCPRVLEAVDVLCDWLGS